MQSTTYPNEHMHYTSQPQFVVQSCKDQDEVMIL